MTTEILKTETNTPEMLERIKTAWKDFYWDYILDEHVGVVGYEHGQHQVTCPCGAAWSVVDAEGPGTVDGFSFEVIDDGDEDYHTA